VLVVDKAEKYLLFRWGFKFQISNWDFDGNWLMVRFWLMKFIYWWYIVYWL